MEVTEKDVLICILSPPLYGPAGDRCVAVERELTVNKPKAMKKENKETYYIGVL